MSRPYVVFHRSTGRVVQTGVAPATDDIAQYAPSPDHEARWLDDLGLMVDYYICPRPEIDLAAVPAGTEFKIASTTTSDIYTGSFAADEPLDLDMPGTWAVELLPPWPYKEFRDEIVVAG